MDFRLKLAIDHFVGGFLAWALNIGARLTALFVHRDHSLRQPPRAALFLKFTGLGSIARSAFLIDDLRARYPSTRIAYAGFPSSAGLLRMYPTIDDVLIVRDDGILRLAIDTLRLIAWSWRHRVDLVIDLEVHSKYSSVVTGMTLARDRAGFGGVTSRFRRGLYTHLVFWNPIRRVDVAYRQLGRAIGLNAVSRWTVPQISEAARREADELVERLGIKADARLLGVNVNASELRVERRWPAENFAAVIEAIPPTPDLHVLLVGSPAERAYVEQVLGLIRNAGVRVHNLAGQISFAGYVALLGRLRLFLTNDSGPLHIAASLGVPTISLWGPTHPAHYAPHGAQHARFYRPLPCSPCVHTTDVPPCGGDNQCLKRLPWQRVARELCRRLEVRDDGVLASASGALQDIPVYGYWRRQSVPLASAPTS